MRRALITALAPLCVATSLVAQSVAAKPRANDGATRLGFSVARLARVDSVLQRAVNEKRIAGAVALVLRDGKVAYEKAVGWSDREANRRMSADAIFRIASQSKAITSVAALSLVEEGKLGLGDPVSRYIPSFEKTSVANGTTVGGGTTPAKRAITIHDLLTHTAGISYGTDPQVASLYEAKGLGPAAGYGWYTADKDEPICESMSRLGTLPFVAQPGEKFVYGYNTDILGCIIERVSGKPLDEFIRERITTPLGLRDTRFYLPTDQRTRLAAVYASGDDGLAVRASDGPRGQGNYVDGPRRSFAGGAGFLSTARDYARFLEMLRNGGELDGVRILAPHTVALMTTNQIGTLLGADGTGFGLGFQTTDRYGVSGMRSVGSFAWGGAYATSYWVDPKERLVGVFMMQMLPSRVDVEGRFEAALYGAMVR